MGKRKQKTDSPSKTKDSQNPFYKQFHKCEPPQEIKEGLKKATEKIDLDRSFVKKTLAKLPPLEIIERKTLEIVGRDTGGPVFPRPLPPLPLPPLFPSPMPFPPRLPFQDPFPIPRTPQWNSVALFYNLADEDEINRPSDYGNTTVQDVRNWMDEGIDPSNPNIKDFTYDYWNTLSYGNLRFSIDVVRNGSGVPIVPTISPSLHRADNYPNIAEAIIRNNPEGVWVAGGRVMLDGKRFIPSVVLVHKYWGHAWAWYGAWLDFNSGGHDYIVGDFTHIVLDLTHMDLLPGGYRVRNWGHPLFHEFAHNFIEGGDLYGPGGCTGYWDILGDYLSPGLMAESCSLFKEKLGWIGFKEVIRGLDIPQRSLNLRPYTSTGEAYKIVPDPENNPYEYFLLEFRKSMGTFPHIPDGGLIGEGLLIIHINERLGAHSKPWVLREAPFFDPEYADFSDFGEAMWHGIAQKDEFKVLYPTVTNDNFTPSSTPNSDFYGGRPSGLSIANIRLSEGRCYFELEIDGSSRKGWLVGNNDRGLAGKFSSSSSAIGQEIFFRNDNAMALLVHQGGQVFVKSKQEGWINGWNLGTDNREIVGDFDGDGRDEIFVRSPEWAGLFKYFTNHFRCETVQHDRIDGWNLGADNRELAADLDGDGKDEIYIRSPRWAGVISFSRGRFLLRHIVHERIGEWHLGPDNEEFIGRFTQNSRDEILIKSPERLGLIYWSTSERKLKLRSIQLDRIDGWNLGQNDKIFIADLDGDGLSEIYIRSAEWAGVLKWQENRFQVLWTTHQYIPDINDNEEKKLRLSNEDRSYPGKFFTSKDGIVHRNANKLALLIWENNRMNVRFKLSDSYTRGWGLGDGDRFILGDYHKIGIEGHAFNDSRNEVLPYDHVTNDLTDIFIHNGRGTGLACVNYVPTDFADSDWKGSEWVLSWIQNDYLLIK